MPSYRPEKPTMTCVDQQAAYEDGYRPLTEELDIRAYTDLDFLNETVKLLNKGTNDGPIAFRVIAVRKYIFEVWRKGLVYGPEEDVDGE